MFSGSRRLFSFRDDEANGDKLLEQISRLYPDVRSSSHILSVAATEGNFLDEVSNPVYFLRLLDSLLDCVRSLERGDHLIVAGFPLLTRKLVGLLVLFSQHFEEVGFVRAVAGRDAVFFSEFRGTDDVIDAGLNDVRRRTMKETVSVDKVVEILTMEKLTAQPFYDLVFAHNTNLLRSKALQLLAQATF